LRWFKIEHIRIQVTILHKGDPSEVNRAKFLQEIDLTSIVRFRLQIRFEYVVRTEDA